MAGAPSRALRLRIVATVLLAMVAGSCGVGEVGEGEDLSGYYRSRRYQDREGLCLFRAGRFVYWSADGAEEPRIQTGRWQPVVPFVGSLLAVLDTVQLHGGPGR